jgi:putative serine protease PepD
MPTGRSGGTLVNEAGQVAGIITAIASTGGGYIGRQADSIGVAFAIPVNTARARRAAYRRLT